MLPSTRPLPDGTHQRSVCFGHNSPVYTCSDGLSLDGSCGVGKLGLTHERCLRPPVVGQRSVADHYDMTADDGRLSF